MKTIIRQIKNFIDDNYESNTVNFVKLENFESPLIYMDICNFCSKKDAKLIANLDINKYNEFKNANKSEWEFALDYLRSNGFVQDLPLTSFRNKAAADNEGTKIVLLMGTEKAVDKGSLGVFTNIDMADVVDYIKEDYSIWFKDIMEDLDAFNKPENRIALNSIYKAIFKSIPVDAMKLSCFIDDLEDEAIDTFSELIETIFNTLNKYWNLPRIETSIPTIKSMPTKAEKLIVGDFRFYNSKLEYSNTQLKDLELKFSDYQEQNLIDDNIPFQGFDSYNEFKIAIIDFIKGRNIDEYRKKFLQSDFGIINKILNIKVKDKVKRVTVLKLKGSPLEVYLKAIISSIYEFKGRYDKNPVDIEIAIQKIELAGYLDEGYGDDETPLVTNFINICSYMGGLLDYIIANTEFFNRFNIKYESGIDPFDADNLRFSKPKLKAIDKMGANSRITFMVKCVGDEGGEEKKREFKWSFSPYSMWNNAFSLLRNVYEKYSQTGQTIPYLMVCNNIEEFIGCETEEEFYTKLESIQYELIPKYSDKLLAAFGGDNGVLGKFAVFNEYFDKWEEHIFKNGFFNCVDEMNRLVITSYTDMIEAVSEKYDLLTSGSKEKIPYILNCLTIIDNKEFTEELTSKAVVVPSYHPAILEKINAQNYYIIYSFNELMNQIWDAESDNYEKEVKVIYNELDKIYSMSAITQALDAVTCDFDEALLCRNLWGYFALYYGDGLRSSYITSFDMIANMDEDDVVSAGEDDLDSAVVNNKGKTIRNNIKDYINTFPARVDGLNIVFVTPDEIQYVVKGLDLIAKYISDKKIDAIFNVKVICYGGSKDISGYLKYWLNNYMAKENTVKINAYLKYISKRNAAAELEEVLSEEDICFVYDILKTSKVEFDEYLKDENKVSEDDKLCQFPMTFVPDTITVKQGNSRKINISQPQFFVSMAYTQLVNKVINRNIRSGKYKAMQVLSLDSDQKNILNVVHDRCKWVVCEDKAIDRTLLDSGSSKIIGFTTGEGCFGEYNVTVSAKREILVDISKRLKERLISKFNYWQTERAEKAAENCIRLTESFDGSRILKALNPYDYEIHNFLAYALTVKKLGISKGSGVNSKFLSQNLLNLDSYKHWLDSEFNRPDFMLIEIPVNDDLYDVNKPVSIEITVMECKMTMNISSAIEKAKKQIEAGIKALKGKWDHNSDNTSRRYWLTQLYRAIAFSELNIKDNDLNYAVLNKKIYDIINGNFVIKWQGEIFAYDLSSDSAIIEREKYYSDCLGLDITINTAGQLYVQKMLAEDEIDIKFVELPANCGLEEQEESGYDTSEPLEDNKTTNSVAQNNDEVPKEPTNVNQNVEAEQSLIAPKADTSVKKELKDVRFFLGTDLKSSNKYYWEFGNGKLNNRHLLINGNSGCGKTYCIQGLLLEAAMQGISSVIFDYTGGFANSKLEPYFKEKLAGRIEQRVVKVSKIPINPFEAHKIQIDDECYVPEENVDVASKMAEIFRSSYHLGEQQKSIVYQAVYNGLNEYGKDMDFHKMICELEKIKKSDSVLSKIREFVDFDTFTNAEKMDWSDIRDADGRIYVIQLAGYTREVQTLLTELLLWDVWYFCVKDGDESKPLILVMDEAQNISHGEKSPSAKILTEGRKFGISGWYATQFMKAQMNSDEIQRLQQAGQKLYFCPPDESVPTVAKNIDISEGRKEWEMRLTKLQKGQCVPIGGMVVNGVWSKYAPKVITVPKIEDRFNDND